MSTSSPRQSQNLAFFEKASEELYDKLRTVPGPDAAQLAERARQLRDDFRGWALQRPTDDDRVRAIQALLDFTREASEFLTHH